MKTGIFFLAADSFRRYHLLKLLEGVRTLRIFAPGLIFFHHLHCKWLILILFSFDLVVGIGMTRITFIHILLFELHLLYDSQLFFDHLDYFFSEGPPVNPEPDFWPIVDELERNVVAQLQRSEVFLPKEELAADVHKLLDFLLHHYHSNHVVLLLNSCHYRSGTRSFQYFVDFGPTLLLLLVAAVQRYLILFLVQLSKEFVVKSIITEVAITHF
jgi:hypothetical protein